LHQIIQDGQTGQKLQERRGGNPETLTKGTHLPNVEFTLTSQNFRNNALSGSIPDTIRELNRLIYVDLSNNQLTGLFPEWVHSLTRLKLLNLGQNHFSGQIPLFIGGRLKNLRSFFNSPAGRRDKYLTLRERYKGFFRAYYFWTKSSNDLFWVDSRGVWNDIKFTEILNEYLKAEANQITSMVFENIRRDPVRIMELLGSSPKPHIINA
jgi:hypothetical protein